MGEIDSGNLLYSTGSSALFCDDLDGWDSVQGDLKGRGYVCIDS